MISEFKACDEGASAYIRTIGSVPLGRTITHLEGPREILIPSVTSALGWARCKASINPDAWVGVHRILSLVVNEAGRLEG